MSDGQDSESTQSAWIIGLNSPTIKTLVFEDGDDAESYLNQMDIGADAVEVEYVPQRNDPHHSDPGGYKSTREAATASWEDHDAE